MHYIKRRLARTIPCPRTTPELDLFVVQEHEIQIQNLLYRLNRAVNGCSPSKAFHNAGHADYEWDSPRKLFNQYKLPCLKEVVRTASKVNMKLDVRAFPLANSFAAHRCCYSFDATFEHAEFAAFLLELKMQRLSRGDSQEMKEERERIFANLCKPGFRVHWTTLIRYAAACGYQLNFYLNEKPTDQAMPVKVNQDEALHRKLDYPM